VSAAVPLSVHAWPRGGHAGRTPTIPTPTSSWPSAPMAALPVTASRYRQGRADMTAVSAQHDRASALGPACDPRPDTPSEASDRRGHQPGHRHQPGHVCRTPSVRTAVVPEAAERSIRCSSQFVVTSSTGSSRPACGRPPAAAVLGRRHDSPGVTGLTRRPCSK
jgi:hypothetical protein